MVLKKKRFSSFASTVHTFGLANALVCYIPYIPEISDPYEQEIIANDSPDAPREYTNLQFFLECGHVSPKNVGFSRIHTLGAFWVASKEKESLLAMICPKGSTTAILPMARFRSKYSHTFNHARDVHPDGCKAIQMFSTNLSESVFVREVFSKQTRKTRVSDT